MASPADERDEPQFQNLNSSHANSEEDGTVYGDDSTRKESDQLEDLGLKRNQPTLDTMTFDRDHRNGPLSPSQTREQARRLDDDLKLLQVERQVSKQQSELGVERTNSTGARRERAPRQDVVDEFDIATNPLHEKTQIYRLPEHPTTATAKLFKKIHQSGVLVRYFMYIVPLVLIILIPLLLGALLFKKASVGGVKLEWFCIWLEIVWLTLWGGRILAKLLPWPMGLVASLFTNNDKKWRDMGKQLEVSVTLFFWWLGIEVSFLPTMIHHQTGGRQGTQSWMTTMNKVLVSCLIGALLNFIEKIIIQLIAISFHLRTYQDRIELNKFQIGSLTKLYQFSKDKIHMEDSDFEAPSAGGPGSGARTPGQLLEKANKNTKQGFRKFGDVAGKIAGDFTGHEVTKSTHPAQVVLALLGTTGGSQVLARRLYRTFAREETETVFQDDLTAAFENQEEADAAFSMFDRDMNGDISMEELEAVCVEMGRERKSITASLKDLDSVVSKLDNVFVFIVLVITTLVFISLISTSAAGVLTSAGSAVLALSWLFSATAQEFLQSVIFVFVKHPFDVGDRVTIYGNTGATLKGDDYFVKEIALLYTEFKKMEGHVVQAPNSYLNTLFILNQRRSGGLAEAVLMTFKFGTTLDQIDGLRQKLLEFVRQEKREYQPNILTELRDVVEAHSLNINIIFFFKSNWQNELLRLQRRNKFICAMMVAMQELGIEGPRMRYPGQKESFPVYLQGIPFSAEHRGKGGHPDNPAGLPRDEPSRDEPFVSPLPNDAAGTNAAPPYAAHPPQPAGSSSIAGRAPAPAADHRVRRETLSAMDRRVDFSLGMKDISSGDLIGDVDRDSPSRPYIPISRRSPSSSRPRQSSASRPRESIDSVGVGRSTSRNPSVSVTAPQPPKLHLSRASTVGAEPASTAHRRSIASFTHHNRFFGSVGRRSHDNDAAMAEFGMAGIPENDGAAAETYNLIRMDPRSGVVSPQAVRMDRDESA